MKKLAAFVLAASFCLSACPAGAATLTGLETDNVGRSWADNLFFSRMESLTGVHMDATGVTDAKAYAELLSGMAQGSIPADVLFKANLTREQEQSLLDCGALIDLAPLIEENMPHLSALLAAHPDWKQVISLEDGRIASLPLFNTSERQVCVWLNTKWLETLGLETPTSVDELTDVLLAFKDRDPNGNYKQDEIAADLIGVYEMRWLLPYFGIVADDSNLARNESGELVFAPELPAYRQFIETLCSWVQSGILPRSAFTATHSTAALNSSSVNEEKAVVTSGMIVTMTPYTNIPSTSVSDYEALLMPDSTGVTRWRDMLGDVWTGCFAVTSSCKDPAEALRWADALYTEEGALLAYAGVEGEDYAFDANGLWSFKVDDSRTINDIRANVLMYTGASMPGLYPSAFIKKVNSPIDEHVLTQNERVHAVSEQVIPAHALGLSEQARANELTSVLGGLVDRGIARFATGEVELNDETYASWLAELKAAGSDELVDLYKGL